jgi:nucleotide-binding universal stress UspA family protein
MQIIQSNLKPPLYWKNILAPVDFCDSSRGALKLAAGLAEQSGALLTLLHVVHFPVSYPIDALLDLEDLMSSARDSLERISSKIPVDLILQKRVVFGKQDIFQEIIEVAGELPADLIVTASPEHGGLARVLHGSITEKLVRHAPCPVLVTHLAKAMPTRLQVAELSNPFKKAGT